MQIVLKKCAAAYGFRQPWLAATSYCSKLMHKLSGKKHQEIELCFFSYYYYYFQYTNLSQHKHGQFIFEHSTEASRFESTRIARHFSSGKYPRNRFWFSPYANWISHNSAAEAHIICIGVNISSDLNTKKKENIAKNWKDDVHFFYIK